MRYRGYSHAQLDNRILPRAIVDVYGTCIVLHKAKGTIKVLGHTEWVLVQKFYRLLPTYENDGSLLHDEDGLAIEATNPVWNEESGYDLQTEAEGVNTPLVV